MIEEKYEQKLTEYILLEDLRKKLWTSDGKSRVSIMIGAGFSRNASKLDSSLKSMSLWSDLRKKLLEHLGDDKEFNDLDVLSLGDIYEEKFGIINLENLLKTEIPDENYEPNFLYTKLLSLPFADVYTTNYDTLLERASRDVFNRRYQVIHDIHDIPGSISPRIVKLHGTFPSHRPFVFSKKSYDSYPRESAPFVNMVQQSIMETTLVLVGFSGDDPNFKKWIEWVSNSLGEHRPKIYLLGLNIEKNSIFTDNKISIIDFNKVYSDLEIDNQYAVFFDELFGYLSDNPTIDQRKWPYIKYPLTSPINKVNINELISTLKKNRETYPGWLIMPSKIKNRRWMGQYISNYFNLLEKDISLEIKMDLAFELVWLLRNFRIPIFFQDQKRLENIIKKFSSNINDERIISIVLFLIREARLDVSDEFFEYIDLIDGKSLHSNQKNELIYQKLLWDIDVSSEDAIKSKIYSWEIEDNSLDYKIRKAAILFRLNENEEALIIIKNILQNARRIQSISRKNYFALSVEGVVLTLLQKFERGSTKENYFDRLIELDQSFCTPATTIDYISNFKREKVLNTVEEKRTYDGKKTISYNIGNYGQSDEIDAFFLISLHEHYCIGINDRKRIEVLKYLYKNYPIYAQKKFFAFAKVKEIDEFFSKNKILNLNEKQINSLFSYLKNLFGSESKRNIDMVLDVLFRLYEVLHQNQREELESILIH